MPTGRRARVLQEGMETTVDVWESLPSMQGIRPLITDLNTPEIHKKIHKGRPGAHYDDRAFDIQLPGRQVSSLNRIAWDEKIHPVDMEVRDTLQEVLGGDWLVILEQHQKNPWYWHIHIQYNGPSTEI